MLTQARLKEVLHYEPETGAWVWCEALSHRAVAGRPAGCVATNGYRYIGVDARRYLAHRLAWLYMTGEWPAGEIDHKDNAKDDGRWSNLRLATGSQNQSNKPGSANGSSKFKGVSRDAKRGRWRAQISIDGKNVALGRFRDEREAAETYIFAAMQQHGEFARFI